MRIEAMGWFSRKPTQQKQVGGAIKVASNLYLHTIPGGKLAPVPLQFSLPDSRYRYMIFCVSATTMACAPVMKNPDAVQHECMQFLVTWTTTEGAQEFFGGPVNPQDVANNGAAYLQAFLNTWSACVELEKEGKNAEIIDLICSMIRTTESNVAVTKSDTQRLGALALQIRSHLPTMRAAFIELVNGEAQRASHKGYSPGRRLENLFVSTAAAGIVGPIMYTLGCLIGYGALPSWSSLALVGIFAAAAGAILEFKILPKDS
jgi:hypothetical protein